MNNKLVVISTICGGILEIIDNGIDGYLYDIKANKKIYNKFLINTMKENYNNLNIELLNELNVFKIHYSHFDIHKKYDSIITIHSISEEYAPKN